MKKYLFIVIIGFLGGKRLPAQDIFFPSKEGVELCYDYCDNQGKLLEYVHHTVLRATMDERVMKIYYRGDRFSPKMTLLHTEKFSSEQSENGFLLGLNKAIFTSLNGTRVTKTGSNFIIGNTGTLTVKAGSFACFEHEFKSNDYFHQRGIPPFHYRVWLAKDVGIVKIERYNTQGRREFYLELAEIREETKSQPVIINLQTQPETPRSTPVIINLQQQE